MGSLEGFKSRQRVGASTSKAARILIACASILRMKISRPVGCKIRFQHSSCRRLIGVWGNEMKASWVARNCTFPCDRQCGGRGHAGTWTDESYQKPIFVHRGGKFFLTLVLIAVALSCSCLATDTGLFSTGAVSCRTG